MTVFTGILAWKSWGWKKTSWTIYGRDFVLNGVQFSKIWVILYTQIIPPFPHSFKFIFSKSQWHTEGLFHTCLRVLNSFCHKFSPKVNDYKHDPLITLSGEIGTNCLKFPEGQNLVLPGTTHFFPCRDLSSTFIL